MLISGVRECGAIDLECLSYNNGINKFFHLKNQLHLEFGQCRNAVFGVFIGTYCV
jgi:hypothetical protein